MNAIIADIKKAEEGCDAVTEKRIQKWLSHGDDMVVRLYVVEYVLHNPGVARTNLDVTLLEDMLTKFFLDLFKQGEINKDDEYTNPTLELQLLLNCFHTQWESGDRAWPGILKNVLKNIYLKGDKGIRELLVAACLEHLLDDKEVIEFFRDWDNNDLLKQAYEAGIKFGANF